MYVKTRNATSFSLIEAKDIQGKRVQYKKDGLNMNKDYQLILDIEHHPSSNNIELNMDLFLEWFGYWISDGWVYESNKSEYRIEVCLCIQKDRERFTELSKGLGYNVYSSSDHTKLFITNKQLASYLFTYSKGAIHKSLPDWVWKLSERQARILISGLVSGDGTVMKNGVERFFTSSVILSDQFQRLCLHAGWSANKKKMMDAGTKISIKGKHTQANADFWALTINKHKNTPMVNHGHVKEQKIQTEGLVQFTGKVYCIEVPSHIFYVRRNGKPVWTGNSNRHGQKGTIGALLRAHDMPRTESGIVPDMIMNPHAIPSRMTIAQNLEQLLGKTAALSGGIGDGTSFMNDGSPQEAIGGILEQFGFEKYGNEVMYNGATGEQIPTAIFIGPVYGMRLKHMVEDKWNARGQGRREQRTHQPTGGRGAQGGLKIGEMDRDAIIAHGGMSFVKESFMERSDKATIPLCVACGMIPIFNPQLNLAICQMCDGPVKYMGDNINNLEILPPLGRPKSKIVQVEMPYSTKLLSHEQETYLNLAMRYMTTSGFERLTPFEFSGTSSEIVKELPQMIVPEMVVPAYVEDKPSISLTVEQLRSMSAQVDGLTAEEKSRLDTIQEEMSEESGATEEMVQMGQMNAMAALKPLPADGEIIEPVIEPVVGSSSVPLVEKQQNEVVYPMVGGLPMPDLAGTTEGVIGGSTIPGVGPMIAVRTDRDAFESDGIYLEGGNRPIRRNAYRNQMMHMPHMPQLPHVAHMPQIQRMGTPMSAMMERFSPMSGAQSGQGSPLAGQTVTVNKLE
jgi:hypothetical protein